MAAASDLKFALDELIERFERDHPDFEVEPTYGSSGQFFAQLSSGAPFDLFLSADVAYPRRLIEEGRADSEDLFLYALGRLVVWVPADSALDLEGQGIRALVDPRARRIAIANPRHAPYGRVAEAALRALGVYQEIEDRLVLGENIAQTAQFIESGGAEAGLIALSLAQAPTLRDAGRSWLVPPEAHPPLVQGGLILAEARDRAAAREFRDFLIGTEGREVLARYGFEAPPEE